MSDHHDEHYESIPWDALVTDDARRRRRWLYLVAGVIVALAVGGAVGRSLAPVASTAPTSGPEDPGRVTSTAATDVPQSTSVGERDQRAVRTAESYASWFVADYFTIDGSDVTRQAVIDRLPPDVVIPEIDDSARSFVESVFPVSVDDLGGGRFEVVAVVRSLAAADGTTYSRQPARAVAIVVLVGADTVGIVDLPRPVALETVKGRAIGGEKGEAPDPVLAAASEEAATWGNPVGVPAVLAVGERWRVSQLVVDDEGLSWAIASWFESDGTPSEPPG
jgi:hypothetical protein